MDPDTEFNALAALYQSVVSDMKHSYSAWEHVGQKAVKLAASLRQSTQALQGFVDAVQAVSDLANNLKGASRDVGACVTRVCMRERALETRLRAVADALSDQVAVTIQQRTGYWKSRTADLDKQNSKHVKKVRSRKSRPDHACVAEQRQLCTQALLEQRQQFTFFIQAIMPFLNEEMTVLDEGPHIHQVVDQMDTTMKHVDGTMLVHTILADLTQGAEHAWRQCLSTATRSFRNGSEDPSPTRSYGSDLTCETDATPVVHRQIQTIGSAPNAHPPLTSLTFTAPDHTKKPPLSRRTSSQSVMSKMSTPPPEIPFRGSTQDINSTMGRQTRPQSFAGDLRSPPLHQAELRNQYGSVTQPQHIMSSFGQQSQNNGSYGTAHGSSSCSSSDAASSAALIAETLQQIDQLGSDLENYCSAQDRREQDKPSPPRVHTNGVAQHTSCQNGVLSGSNSRNYEQIQSLQRPNQLPPPAYNNSTIRMRNGHGDSSRPPPPERRSSQITAATPTAPSIAEARMSMMGSRHSLTSSTGIYGGLNSSSQDLRYSNVNPYNSQKFPPF